jgi:hypothetical protein
MSRHINYLERLLNRLQCWLGTDDELVQQVKHELESNKRMEKGQDLSQDWSVNYRKFLEIHPHVKRTDGSNRSRD